MSWKVYQVTFGVLLKKRWCIMLTIYRSVNININLMLSEQIRLYRVSTVRYVKWSRVFIIAVKVIGQVVELNFIYNKHKKKQVSVVKCY